MDKIVIRILVVAGMLLTALPDASYGQSSGAASQNWDAVVAQAKKEGSVSLYALWMPAARVALTEAFRNRYGINLEFTPFSRGEDLAAKASQEKKAGLNLVDFFGAGAPSIMTVFKPAGLLGPIKPLLMLPEVTDPKFWRESKFPFMDADQQTIAMLASINRDIIYNTGMIKAGEITTYKDLLKPQYKGKIIMNDPSVTGVGNSFMNHMALNIWNLQEVKDYLVQLLTKQDLVLERDNRMHVETVARGKYAIGLANNPEILANFLNVGSPLGVVYNKEGIFVGPAAGSIAAPATVAHPNAAKVFINWLLSKEGQAVFSPNFGTPSLRVDVPTTGIATALLVQPGEKIYFSNETEIDNRPKIRALCKEIIDGLKK